MINDLIINLLASFIFLIVGLSFTKIRRYINTWAIRNIWQFTSKKNAVSVVLSTRPGPHSHSTPRVSLEEMKAYARINNVLKNIGIDVTPLPSNISINKIKNTNLILLGGSKANQIVSRFQSYFDDICPFKLDLDTQTIKSINKNYEPQKNSSDKWMVDYAIVCKAKNPLNPSYSIISSQGCHGFSTYAGIKFLLNEENSKKINKVVNNNNFSILLEVTLVKNSIIQTKIIDFYHSETI